MSGTVVKRPDGSRVESNDQAPARPRRSAARWLAVLGLVAAAAAILGVISGSDPYTIQARFLDAGQLVKGAEVEVAGRKVGSVADLRITRDGLAMVELEIDDDGVVPLRAGTRARIRAVGPAGLTNRYVALDPGPEYAPALSDGAVLDTDRTRGIVDIDQLLTSFDPSARRNFRRLMDHGAEIFAGSGSRWFSGTLAQASPAFREISGMTGELAADGADLDELVGTGAVTARAIASRRTDLESALVNMATAFGTIAQEREAYAGILARSPAVLRQGASTLPVVRSTLADLRPALRRTPAAAGPLRRVLERLAPTARGLTPVTRQLTSLLPPLNATFNGLRPLRSLAEPALRTTATSLQDSMHIIKGLRYFGADLIIGVFGGLNGIAAAPYDQNGHYDRIQFLVSPQGSASGLASILNPEGALIPGLFSLRFHKTNPCPGGAAAPAPDGSNPWIPDPSICDPEHNHP